MWFVIFAMLCLIFFFQAEDGIRDVAVTGVQTCALPIYRVQQRDVRPRHRHPRDLLAARRGGGDPRVLPGPRAHEGAAGRHRRDAAPAGGRPPVGLPDAAGRPRARARETDAPLRPRPLPRASRQRGGPPVSDARPLVEELVPAPDPFETCIRFAGLPSLVFLDSATDAEHLGRHSFLTADPWSAVRSKALLTQQLVDGRWVRVEPDALTHARALLAPHAAEPLADLPPFQGGAAGYLGYDWGATLERVPRPRYDDYALPDVLLGLYDWVIAWDHPAGRAWVISTGIPERGTARTAARRHAARPIPAAAAT